MNKKTAIPILVPILVLILVFIAGCSGDETPSAETPQATSEATVGPEATELPAIESVEMLELTSADINEVQNINWQWSEFLESEPASQSVVPDPENYTIVFNPDNTFNFQADCNVGSGNYSAEGSSLSLELGPITLASCGPDSLHDEYLIQLAYVTDFGMSDGKLVLVTEGGSAQMIFINGGAVEVEEPEPEPEICAGINMSSWELDTGVLPYSWQANCLPETPYDASQPPGPTGLPEHAQINFGVTNPEDRQPGDPIIYVIPVEAYEQMYAANGDQTVTNAIDELQTLLVDQPVPIPTSNIPVLPYEEVTGVNDLAVQGEYLDIQMGSGMRFVGRFSQGPNPVTNDNPPLYYIFQGFTDDGVYLISFFYPVDSFELPNSDDLPDGEAAQADSDTEAYMAAKAEELNALTASDWEPELTSLDAVINSLLFEYQTTEVEEPTATAQLTNINWQWTELSETDPAGQSLVPNPERYVLIFLNDGRVDILADCNFGSGTYVLDGNNMTITVEAMTEIACDEGSQSEQFVALLGEVGSYQLSVPKLTLDLKEDAGRLGFANSGKALVPPQPGEGVPTATTIEPVNVRSGPGTAYSSYGVVPANTSFEVIGVSEDGGWWVVKLPTDVAPDGQGWISANYVETENTENVPIIPAPPLEGEGPPPEGAPTATAIEPINVRSGPGTTYPSYGVAPIGATALVIGVSEDGQWWVIQIPTDIAADGRGWVNANYVEVTNAEDVPVIETPPVP